MVIYKQILTMAVFVMVNLCILGTVVSEEENVANVGNEISGSMPDDEAIETSDAVPAENQPDSEIKDVVESPDMLEAIQREKAELDKLKLMFHSAEKLAEDKREKERDGRNDNYKKSKSEIILTNYEKTENSKEHVDEQNILISPEVDGEVEETITFVNEDNKVQEIEDIVKNGEEIVHPFEIAENLYKLGEYKIALEIYKLIDIDKIKNEMKIWVLYQTANCYRKLELYDDAVKVYRDLRDGYEGTYWSKQAQWYIRDIEWRTRAEEKMVKVIEK